MRRGTDGWRGIIADEFTYDRLWLVACALVRFLLSFDRDDRHLLLVGYDTRFNSDGFAKLCATAAAMQDVRVRITSTFVPSPAISFAVVDDGADGGIEITASHNPASYNGIKYKSREGAPASATMTREIEGHLEAILKEPPERPDIPFESLIDSGQVTFFDPRESYLDSVVSLIRQEVFSSYEISVVFDAMYGAGQELFPLALKRLGYTCFPLHCEHNPRFPGIRPEPIEENLTGLRSAVISGRYDVGIALDGDADRVGAIDACGEFINSHMIFALILKHLVEVRGMTGDVVKSVTSSSMIDALCERYGIQLYVVPVGFKYVAELMLDEEILIGGEEAGGIAINGHIPDRDGILAGLMLVEIMATHRKGLAELVSEMEEELGRRFVYSRKDIPAARGAQKELLKLLPGLAPDSIEGLKVVDTETVDGQKFNLEDGSWVMLRVSGTEPVVRVYAESTGEDLTARLVAAGQRMVEFLPRVNDGRKHG